MKEDWRLKKRAKRLEEVVERYHIKSGFKSPLATNRYLKGMKEYLLFAEEKIREVLEEKGISVAFFWGYYAFGRRAFKKIKEGKIEEIPYLIEIWKKRGLSEEVLGEIVERLREVPK